VLAFAGAGDPAASGSRLAQLCTFLAESPDSPIRKYTPPQADCDTLIDVRAIIQSSHRELAAELIPPLLVPPKGRYGLRDYEKVFCAELPGEDDIYTQRGIDRVHGCVVIVRPDQFVANVLPLDGLAELAAFFDRFMIPARALAIRS
jgi:phenol 2-monooxygenase